MKIIVCGGRDYADRGYLFGALDEFTNEHDVSHIIHGGAKGADSLAGDWAKVFGYAEVIVPANWAGQGKSAGYIRNSAMLKLLVEGDTVVAFPGGKGTKMMCKIATEAGYAVERP